MKFYDFAEIQQNGSCLQLARQFGLKATNAAGNMFNIPWRSGSDSGALSVSDSGWKDFVSGESGGIVEFVRRVKFLGAPENRQDKLQDAQEWLGNFLGLSPAFEPEKKQCISQKNLEVDGFSLKKTYEYRNKNNKLCFIVQRWQRGTEKQFLQLSPDGKPGISNCEPTLYRWNELHDRENIYLVEGEKDADTLNELGFPATTANGGAGNWRSDFTSELSGKSVVVVADNDEAGEKRADFLFCELKKCKNLYKVSFPGEPAGFDATDFLHKYGYEALRQKLTNPVPVEKDKIKSKKIQEKIKIAKRLNEQPFSNFTWEDDSTGKKKVAVPKQLAPLVNELFDRFLGFPAKLGDTLFDHDIDTGEINFITSADQLFSWIQIKGKTSINWAKTNECFSKKEFFCGVQAVARKYEEIAKSPTFPARHDVYNEFEDLPEPDPDKKYLWQLVKFFSPENESYKTLIAALFCSPFYFEPGKPRPAWIIDSDGRGCGKTTLAETVAKLTNTVAVRTNYNELEKNFQELTKRLVSHTGRLAKVLLVDNVDDQFASAAFADLITAEQITGRPPYGRGEESRPNNLTYIVTANSASVNSDMAARAFFVKLKRIEHYNQNWKSELEEFIAKNRLHIFADILSVVSQQKQEYIPFSRFPEFESHVLAGLVTPEEAQKIKEQIQIDQQNSNEDSDLLNRVESYFFRMLAKNNLPPKENYFILSEVAERWIRNSLPENQQRGNTSARVRDLIRQGKPEFFYPAFRKSSRKNGKVKSFRGFVWIGGGGSEQIVGYVSDGSIGIVF